jgi:ketosteroid isomerase-like protein
MSDSSDVEIQRRIARLVDAVRAADLDGVMSIYAPDLVTFDIVAPLQKIGADGKRANWRDVFAMYQRPLGYEVRDVKIGVSGDVAFAHSLNRISGTLRNGSHIAQWLRWTACFRKVGRIGSGRGDWLIVHDHVSVPTDFATGRALLGLAP